MEICGAAPTDRPMTDASSGALRIAFSEKGFVVVRNVVDASAVDRLVDATAEHLSRATGRGGVRHILRDVDAVRALAVMPQMRAIAEAAVGVGAKPVRGILFDKNPDANWKVIWHQDLTIAVRERRDIPEFGPWTEKDGAPHVQPPLQLLQNMVAVRLHLDDCTSENGPVKVIPGSHRHGKLSGEAIDAWRAKRDEIECTVDRGGVLAFHSLLLHASAPAIKPAHRRVVHIEYVSEASAILPAGLAWNETAR